MRCSVAYVERATIVALEWFSKPSLASQIAEAML
jgi:hypothetical protein